MWLSLLSIPLGPHLSMDITRVIPKQVFSIVPHKATYAFMSGTTMHAALPLLI
jgi:hypothetical protein